MMSANNSYRILTDLRTSFAPGSSSLNVDKLSLGWFTDMLRHHTEQDIFALVNEKRQIPLLQPHKRILFPPLPTWSSKRDWRGGEADSLSNIAYSTFVAPYRADIILISHIFTDYASDPIGLPHHALHPSAQILAVTVRDFIPIIFSEHYFQHTDFKKFYLSRLQWLRKADVIFTASRTTREDAVNRVGLAPEKVVVIPPYLDQHHYRPGNWTDDEKDAFLHAYGIRRPFLLYVGNDEYHTNLDGAVRAFALLPPELRTNYQLVIVCRSGVERVQEVLHIAAGMGFSAEDVVFIDIVPDADMPKLYGLCALFVYPSWYEGLPLSLLEAMACGAPVLAGDNSSLKEIINYSDALFNAHDDATIAANMRIALENDGFTRTLREYGVKRAREICGKGAGQVILNAFSEALTRKRSASLLYTLSGGLPCKQLAVVTPLPAEQSGVAHYSAELLPYLAEYFDIDVYTTCKNFSCPHITSAFRVYDVKDFPAAASSYDHILYEFGNSPFHAHMFGLMERFPGVVTLHDAYLSGALYSIGRDIFIRESLYSHASQARRIFLSSDYKENIDRAAIIKFPCTKRILERSLGIISHSIYQYEIIEQFYGKNFHNKLRIVPHHRSVSSTIGISKKLEIRKKYGFTENDILIVSFGDIVFTKKPRLIAESFLSNEYIYTNEHIKLLFIGKIEEGSYEEDFLNFVKNSLYNSKIIITGYVSDSIFNDYLDIADIAIQLRCDSRGETSGAVLRAISHGIPTIVNNYATFSVDFSDDAVIKISENPDAAEIGQCLEKLCRNPDIREKFSYGGQDFIRKNNDPHHCAALYAMYIHEFYDVRNSSSLEKITDNFARCIASSSNVSDIEKVTEWISENKNISRVRRKLFIDVSFIISDETETNLGRVIKEIVKTLYCVDSADVEVVAVTRKNGNFLPAISWLKNQGLLLPEENNSTTQITFSSGDILLLSLESWYTFHKTYLHIFGELKNVGADIVGIVYQDNLSNVQFCKHIPYFYTNELQNISGYYDQIVGVSLAVSDNVAIWWNIAGDTPEYKNIQNWEESALQLLSVIGLNQNIQV